MASDSSRKSDSAAARRNKPKPPVIDLTATEVAASTDGEAQAAMPTEPTAATEAPLADQASPGPVTVDAAADSTGPDELPPSPAAADEAPVAADAEAATTVHPEAIAETVSEAPAGETVATEDEAVAPQPSPAASPARPSLLPLFAAALLGGVVALAGGGLILSYSGILAPAAAPVRQAEPMPQVDLGPIESRLAALSQRVDALRTTPAPAEPVDLSPLEDRLATLEAAIKAVPAPDTEALAAVRKSVEDLSARSAADIADLKARPAVDPQKIAEIADRTAAASVGLASLEGRVAGIEARLAEGPKGGEVAALSLAVAGLGSKVAAGLPFATDLAVIRTAAPDLQGIDALVPLADKGVPTLDELRASLPVDEMMAHRPVDTEAGIMNGFLSSAKSLVNYRATGSGTRDPASAGVEAIETALRTGDAAGARAAAEALPDWAKAPAAGWIARLEARVVADTAVKAVTDRLLDRLRQPADAP